MVLNRVGFHDRVTAVKGLDKSQYFQQSLAHRQKT